MGIFVPTNAVLVKRFALPEKHIPNNDEKISRIFEKISNQIEKIDTIYTKAACKRVFNYKLKKLKPAVD